MKSKFARVLIWAVVNAAAGALLYFAAIEHVQGAANAFVFLAWVHLFAGLAACTDDFVSENAAQIRSPSVPVSVGVAYDIACLFALIWLGWWLTGIAWLIGMFCFQIAREKAAKVAP